MAQRKGQDASLESILKVPFPHNILLSYPTTALQDSGAGTVDGHSDAGLCTVPISSLVDILTQGAWPGASLHSREHMQPRRRVRWWTARCRSSCWPCRCRARR